MLTLEQKKMIVKQLEDAYVEFNAFITSIENAGKEALNDMLGTEHKKTADRIVKYRYDQSFQSSIYDMYDTSRSRKAILNKHYNTSYSSVKSISASVYLQHSNPDCSTGTAFKISWSWTDEDELVSYHSDLSWIMQNVLEEPYNFSIEQLVCKHADTRPEKIILLKQFLKCEAKDELVRYFNDLINSYCAGIANAIEKTNKREAELDNMLLSEFNLSNSPAKVKKYSYTFNITKKEVAE